MSRAEELVRLLDLAPQFIDPNPERSHIDGLEHNLRVATLARRWATGVNWDPRYGSDMIDQVTFMGLVHDLARPLSDPFHGEVIAEIVRDMVPEAHYHVLRTHGLYQAWIMHGEPVGIDFSVSWHRLAQALSAWEVASFATDFQPRPIMRKTEAVTLIYKICDGRM